MSDRSVSGAIIPNVPPNPKSRFESFAGQAPDQPPERADSPPSGARHLRAGPIRETFADQAVAEKENAPAKHSGALPSRVTLTGCYFFVSLSESVVFGFFGLFFLSILLSAFSMPFCPCGDATSSARLSPRTSPPAACRRSRASSIPDFSSTYAGLGGWHGS
jgi:hypothetical protein